MSESCHICGFIIPEHIGWQRTSACHPLAGTLDHVIAKSKGGEITKPAHYLCNQLKADRKLTPELISHCQRIVTALLDNDGISIEQAIIKRRAFDLPPEYHRCSKCSDITRHIKDTLCRWCWRVANGKRASMR